MHINATCRYSAIIEFNFSKLSLPSSTPLVPAACTCRNVLLRKLHRIAAGHIARDHVALLHWIATTVCYNDHRASRIAGSKMANVTPNRQSQNKRNSVVGLSSDDLCLATAADLSHGLVP
jgi:hypothetical protein